MVRQRGAIFSQASHPSFAKLLDVVEQGDELVTVTEHLVGAPLIDVIGLSRHNGDTLPVPVAVRIAIDASRSLLKVRQLASRAGLGSTRLFLADSLFVTAFGETLLTEIGVLPAIASCKAYRELPGVLVQLSPEELSPSRTASEAAEVFSLGVLLWEILSGKPPFPLTSSAVTRTAVINQRLPNLAARRMTRRVVPSQLAAIVTKATELSPMKRFQTVVEFAASLENLAPQWIATELAVAEALQKRAHCIVERWSVVDVATTPSGTARRIGPHQSRPVKNVRLPLSDEIPTLSQKSQALSMPAPSQARMTKDDAHSNRQNPLDDSRECPTIRQCPRGSPVISLEEEPERHSPSVDKESCSLADQDATPLGTITAQWLAAEPDEPAVPTLRGIAAAPNNALELAAASAAHQEDDAPARPSAPKATVRYPSARKLILSSMLVLTMSVTWVVIPQAKPFVTGALRHPIASAISLLGKPNAPPRPVLNVPPMVATESVRAIVPPAIVPPNKVIAISPIVVLHSDTAESSHSGSIAKESRASTHPRFRRAANKPRRPQRTRERDKRPGPEVGYRPENVDPVLQQWLKPLGEKH
jgi:serine/threonine protein kinase